MSPFYPLASCCVAAAPKIALPCITFLSSFFCDNSFLKCQFYSGGPPNLKTRSSSLPRLLQQAEQLSHKKVNGTLPQQQQKSNLVEKLVSSRGIFGSKSNPKLPPTGGGLVYANFAATDEGFLGHGSQFVGHKDSAV